MKTVGSSDGPSKKDLKNLEVSLERDGYHTIYVSAKKESSMLAGRSYVGTRLNLSTIVWLFWKHCILSLHMGRIISHFFIYLHNSRLPPESIQIYIHIQS